MLSQRNQKDKYNTISLTCEIKKKQTHQKTKTEQIEKRTDSQRTNRWLPGKGWGGWEMSGTRKGLET